MAFGFIKKIFSFGKKQVEEIPAEELPKDDAALLPAPEAQPAELESVADAVPEPVAVVAPETIPVEAEPEFIEPEKPVLEPVTAAAPVFEAKPEPVVKADKPKPAKAKTEKPKPAKQIVPEAEQSEEEMESHAAEMTEQARSETSFAPDGVYQPSAETADNGLPHIDTPEPLDESPEPQPGNPQPLQDEPVASDEAPDLAETGASDGAFGGEAEVEIVPAFEPVPEVPLVAADIPVTENGAKVFIGKMEEVAPEPEPEEKLNWYQRLKRGLSRTSKDLSSSITGIFTKRKLDEDTLQDLEDVLIRADLGMETAIRITDTLSSGRYGKDVSDEEVRGVMRGEIEKVLGPVAKPLELDLNHKPHVILVVGVNGTGKTTTIGKLAAKLRAAKLNVWLAAGDTFRAAAIEQLHIWGQRTGSPVVSNRIGADAAGLAFDAFEKAKAAGADVLIIDTAGRLQNKAELMDELAKIVRVLGKLDPEAPHTVLQTLDATTGQNALNQVEIFRNVAGVNGLVMTKLDGTARGGILVGIAAKHKLPVYFIGVGEQVADLEPFSAKEFAAAIAGTD